MTPERRAELRKLREAGTPGEWEYVSTPEWTDISVRNEDGSRRYDELTSDDYDLIPAAVNTLVPLLDALDAAESTAKSAVVEKHRLLVAWEDGLDDPLLRAALKARDDAATVAYERLESERDAAEAERDAALNRVAELEAEQAGYQADYDTLAKLAPKGPASVVSRVVERVAELEALVATIRDAAEDSSGMRVEREFAHETAMDEDVELARGVLTETLHGPVPMATVARLAETVLRQAKRVAELETWAKSRIEECRRQEVKFGAPTGRKYASGDALVEAYTERRTLQAVLQMLSATATAETEPDR